MRMVELDEARRRMDIDDLLDKKLSGQRAALQRAQAELRSKLPTPTVGNAVVFLHVHTRERVTREPVAPLKVVHDGGALCKLIDHRGHIDPKLVDVFKNSHT